VDWRTRHLVLSSLTERVERLSRPDEEWLSTPAPAAAPARTKPAGERASVEQALRVLAESRVKMKGVRYAVYEPKTLRLRSEGGDDAAAAAAAAAVAEGGAAAAAGSGAASSSSSPSKRAAAAPTWEERTLEPSFVEVKQTRSPRRLPVQSPLAGLDITEVDEQWRLVQQQHLQRKEAAALKYAAPPSPSPMALAYSGSSSPRTLLRSSSSYSAAAAGRGGGSSSRANATSSGISAVASQVSLTGVGSHYNYAPRHAAEVEQRKRLHSSSATRGGALTQLPYTPAHDHVGFAPSPRSTVLGSGRRTAGSSGGGGGGGGGGAVAIRRTASSPLHPGYALPESSRLHNHSYTADDDHGSQQAASIPEATPPQPQPEPEPEPEVMMMMAASSDSSFGAAAAATAGGSGHGDGIGLGFSSPGYGSGYGSGGPGYGYGSPASDAGSGSGSRSMSPPPPPVVRSTTAAPAAETLYSSSSRRTTSSDEGQGQGQRQRQSGSSSSFFGGLHEQLSLS
jgi:hypothetical protein